ncbi:hypothetical protein I5M27_15040 [Adhaeribacter sp. BT258]|uniref:Glycosyltransferase RgtA/B/C/D-like domain-containing protein n=1 Tax=Adhaeribacter terrigena TaxID=2793070 RepID=A0ABS1C4K2_9BACT|nr:DUF6044 family protein [Adhaeribacter terrigena]MBK0404311.1 hypothetical protein [Adhaeribacter terrigena]
MDNRLPPTPQVHAEASRNSKAFFQPRNFAYAGVLGALCIAFFFLSIRLILGEDSFVTIHDNLDSEIPWRFALAHNQNPDVVPQIMNGLPLSFMTTQLHLVYALFTIFSPFKAYILTEALVHAVAFLGMFLLLHWYFRQYLQHSKLLIFGIALCFSLLPFYSIYGLSVAGQPLLLACFFNLQNRRRVLFSLLYIVFFAFASVFALAGVFIIASAGIWLLWNTFRDRQLNVYFLAGLVLLAVCYCLSEYRLLELMLLKKEPSHRESWDLVQLSKPFGKSLFASLIDFLIGQYHVASQHVFILVMGITAFLLAWYKRLHSFTKPLFGLLVLLGIIALIFGFFTWNSLIPLKEKVTLLKTFNVSRFYFLQPLLWHLVLTFALGALYLQFRSRKMVLALLALQLSFTVGSNLQAENELRTNLRLLAGNFTKKQPNVITYRQYVSAGLFHQIDSVIARPKASYRVVCLGIYPAMAQLNGFYTLDSYQNNYPLRYKKAFREIIAPELAKNPKWQDYYDGWGSRCYLFAAETEKTFPDNKKITALQNFALNNAALKNMNGQYLISAYLLQNAPASNLKLIRKFEHPAALRALYLYAVL